MKKVNMKEVSKSRGSSLKQKAVISNALSINESRKHLIPKTKVTAFIKGMMEKDDSYFDKHKMMFLSYSEDNEDIVSEAIIRLVEKYVDKNLYIVCKKGKTGKSCLFTGECADELISKSDIEVDKKFILKVNGTTANYYRVTYPMRKRIKGFGGERLKDVVLQIGEKED